jgi:hypothetical protein
MVKALDVTMPEKIAIGAWISPRASHGQRNRPSQTGRHGGH